MEKIAIQLWKDTNLEDNEFKGFLLNEFPSTLKDEILSYQVNLADDDVSDASGLIQSSYPPSPNAVLFLKVNSLFHVCLLYTSPSPRDRQKSRMPSSA